MPKTNESINSELHDWLDARDFDPKSFYSNGEPAPSPAEADMFQFQFHKGGIDYGTVTVTIDGNNRLTVYANDDVTRNTQSDGEESDWLTFVEDLKNFASQEHQLKFKVDNLDRLDSHMKKREYTKRKLEEGYYGNRSTSYTDHQPATVKIIIKHNKQLDETDQRFRYIDRIFLETSDGGRWPLSTRKPSEARAFARHLAEGGSYGDDRWRHIQELSENIRTLGGFVRATRNKTFTESVGRAITEAESKYNQFRESIKSLQSTRGYNRYFESWKPTLTECDDECGDQPNMGNMFARTVMDPRIEKALPLLSKLKIYVVSMPEVDEFSSWADGVTDGMIDYDADDSTQYVPEPAYDREELVDIPLEEDMMPATGKQVDTLVELLSSSEEVPVGPDAMNILNQLQGVIDNKHLNDSLRKAARTDPDNDARPIIIGWLEQHRDVPAYDRVLDQIDDSEEKPAPKEEQPVKEETISELSRIRALSGIK